MTTESISDELRLRGLLHLAHDNTDKTGTRFIVNLRTGAIIGSMSATQAIAFMEYLDQYVSDVITTFAKPDATDTPEASSKWFKEARKDGDW